MKFETIHQIRKFMRDTEKYIGTIEHRYSWKFK